MSHKNRYRGRRHTCSNIHLL